MKKVVLLMACMAMCVLGWASITVTGVVTAQEDGEPVIGASVLEVGTTNGTITDFDGRYTITVGDKATLEISYVGMKTKAVKVSGTKHDVVLSTDAIAVQEVVVTAMGVVQEKKRMNFAVQNINSENLTESHSANFVNALQGKVAGLNVTTGSGSPNAGRLSSVVLPLSTHRRTTSRCLSWTVCLSAVAVRQRLISTRTILRV